jgi:hypothetical protein
MLSTKCWFTSASGFRGEDFFLNGSIRNKNCMWRPCLLMNRDKMSILYRGPSIDASYQVSVHLAEGFQRRRLKCEKLTDNIRRTPSDSKSSHCLWQGELINLFYPLISQNMQNISITIGYIYKCINFYNQSFPVQFKWNELFPWIFYIKIWQSVGNSCFWLPFFFKSFPPKPLGQMNRNLVGSI